MSKKIQHVLLCVGFTAVLAAAIYGCSRLLEYKEATEQYTAFYEAETNFDVIFLGTSHAYGSVYPMELWREYGIASYNWGYNHCAVAENYHLMREIVKRTDPKLFVVDLYGLLEYDNWDGVGNGKYRTDKSGEQHVQFDAIPLSRDKIDAVWDIFDDYDQRLDYLWNFILYHNRWEDLGSRDFLADELPLMGATIYSGVGTHGPYTPTETESMDLSEIVGYQYLLKMMAFCAENDIQLLCTYLPYPAKPASQQVANALEGIVNGYPNCRFLNMLEAEGLNYPADLYTDNNHLNYLGACKVTSQLGAYILENYDVTSRGDDPAYRDYWGGYYARYYDYKVNLLSGEAGLYEQLLLLYGTDFRAELTVTPAATEALTQDGVAAAILSDLGGTLTLRTEEEILAGETPCDLQLDVWRCDSGGHLQTRSFTLDGAGGYAPLG